MHQKLLHYLNFHHAWLRYCKMVYSHRKIIFTFLPDHLRKTPGSNKIIFTARLSGHKRNKTLFLLCKYYTTVLKQNICYASPKSNSHLFMLLGCFLVCLFWIIYFSYHQKHAKTNKQVRLAYQALKAQGDRGFLICLPCKAIYFWITVVPI